MNNIRLLRKSLIKNLSALKVIYFVCNSEENKILNFQIYCMLQKLFEQEKKVYVSKLTDTIYCLIIFMLLKNINTLLYIFMI